MSCQPPVIFRTNHLKEIYTNCYHKHHLNIFKQVLEWTGLPLMEDLPIRKNFRGGHLLRILSERPSKQIHYSKPSQGSRRLGWASASRIYNHKQSDTEGTGHKVMVNPGNPECRTGEQLPRNGSTHRCTLNDWQHDVDDDVCSCVCCHSSLFRKTWLESKLEAGINNVYVYTTGSFLFCFRLTFFSSIFQVLEALFVYTLRLRLCSKSLS